MATLPPRQPADLSPSSPIARILYVEDHAEIAQVVCYWLKRDQIEVTVAVTGEAGLEAALKGRFDLFLIDINLPGMNGLELCRRLKERPETKSVPAVFITGDPTAGYRAEAQRLGAVDFLPKPPPSHDFGVLLLKHIANARTRRPHSKDKAQT